MMCEFPEPNLWQMSPPVTEMSLHDRQSQIQPPAFGKGDQNILDNTRSDNLVDLYAYTAFRSKTLLIENISREKKNAKGDRERLRDCESGDMMANTRREDPMGSASFESKCDTERSPKHLGKARYGVLNIERRKYPRLTVLVPVEFYRIGSPVWASTRALDLSEGGLLICFSEKMEVGQRLRLRIYLCMGPTPDIIELISEVAWVGAHIGKKDPGSYRTGVKVVEISPDDMVKLKTFLINPSQPPYTDSRPNAECR